MSADYTGPVCRHVCPACGGCDVCCLRNHDGQDAKPAGAVPIDLYDAESISATELWHIWARLTELEGRVDWIEEGAMTEVRGQQALFGSTHG